MQSAGTGPFPAARLAGELDLRFASDGHGGTVLQRRYRTGHFHVAKPYHDGRQLVAQIVNTTAGIFEGDSLVSHFECGSGARACLLSPSSSQVYTMPGGGGADSRQEISIHSGGGLAVIPRWLVPHRRSRFSLSTRIHLDPDSRLFYLEPISAGRISHGEFLEMDELSCRMEIRIGKRPVLVESLQLGLARNRWLLERNGERFAYLATAYIHFPGAEEFCLEQFSGLPGWPDETVNLGLTALTADLVVIRLLSRTSTEASGLLKKIYLLLGEAVPLSPVLRRI